MAPHTVVFKKVPYKELNARQKELFNFQKIAATLADYGYNCIKLADDWQGADFLAYHFQGGTTLKVQLKSRITINKKYVDKDLWMAFPYESAGEKSWYLVPHDRLVEKVGKKTTWLESPSWKERGGYSSMSINPELLESLGENKLSPVYGSIAEEDDPHAATSAP